MSDVFGVPTIGGAIDRLNKRLFDVERQTTFGEDYRFEMIASGYSLGASAVSTAWRPRQDCALVEVSVDLTSTMGASAVFDVQRDGVTIASCTVPAGSTYGTVSVDPIGCTAATPLQVMARSGTTAGIGATVHSVFIARRQFYPSGGLVFPSSGGGTTDIAYARCSWSGATTVANQTVSGSTTLTEDWDTQGLMTISGGNSLTMATGWLHFVSVTWTIDCLPVVGAGTAAAMLFITGNPVDWFQFDGNGTWPSTIDPNLSLITPYSTKAYNFSASNESLPPYTATQFAVGQENSVAATLTYNYLEVNVLSVRGSIPGA